MMKPQAYEALQKAKALFRHPAEVVQDDIPSEATPIEPIRKPRVVLLPPDAPKFDQHSMKEEHKKMEQAKQTELENTLEEMGLTTPAMREHKKQIDKYADMSVTKACEVCLAKGIKQPANIAKETGKNVNQIYTALWHIKQRKKKAKAQAKEAKRYEYDMSKPNPKFVAPKSLDKVQADWDREPTAWEDAHRVVLHDREWYEAEIEKLATANTDLLIQIQELKTIIKYLEGKSK